MFQIPYQIKRQNHCILSYSFLNFDLEIKAFLKKVSKRMIVHFRENTESFVFYPLLKNNDTINLKIFINIIKGKINIFYARQFSSKIPYFRDKNARKKIIKYMYFVYLPSTSF